MEGELVTLRPLEAGDADELLRIHLTAVRRDRHLPRPRRARAGAGTDAVRVIVRHLVQDMGHHRVTIATAVENVAALRCYEKAGFRRIGVAQAAGRNYPTGKMDDEWLLEQVVLGGVPPPGLPA